MNHTTVREFILLGLTVDHRLQVFLFLFLLMTFSLTVTGNLVIITITLVDRRLHTAMYFFIRNFALLEIFFSSTIMPRFLYSLLKSAKEIPFASCLLQNFFFFFLGTCVFFHVAMMSFDRYLAICYPLQYATIMNSRACLLLVLGCWVVSFVMMFPPGVIFAQLPFCGPNVINHFYCDAPPLLQLVCADTRNMELMCIITAVITLLSTLTVTFVSYSHIISTILHMPSSTSRKRAFSTCSAHLMVVAILYGTSIFRYIRPTQRGGQKFDKNISLFYTVVTQVFNPYIYSLRNKQVKEALKDAWNRRFSKMQFS
ncbi:olfactory receptor 6C4-like [Alligator sinensis]|uniref:Olfactory receptor 6C4-like n=1 Tax=Alligator sinensis TaxID=38654 RepID=A0A1U7SNM2_ALLSI|nr:olfactory receptor 6C4-like [Alligator sinensis]